HPSNPAKANLFSVALIRTARTPTSLRPHPPSNPLRPDPLAPPSNSPTPRSGKRQATGAGSLGSYSGGARRPPTPAGAEPRDPATHGVRLLLRPASGYGSREREPLHATQPRPIRRRGIQARRLLRPALQSYTCLLRLLLLLALSDPWMAGGKGAHGTSRFIRHLRMKRALGIQPGDSMWSNRKMRGRDRHRGTWWDLKRNCIAIEGQDFAQDTEEGGADQFVLIPDSGEERGAKDSSLLGEDDEYVPETEPQDVVTESGTIGIGANQGRKRLGALLHDWLRIISDVDNESGKVEMESGKLDKESAKVQMGGVKLEKESDKLGSVKLENESDKFGSVKMEMESDKLDI
ncbi:unnamed protein product, partial [Urochloa humidicola]